MKKIFSVMVVAIVALCSIVLTSCNSNKSNSASDGENKYTEAPLINDFVLLSTVNDDGTAVTGLKKGNDVVIEPQYKEITYDAVDGTFECLVSDDGAHRKFTLADTDGRIMRPGEYEKVTKDEYGYYHFFNDEGEAIYSPKAKTSQGMYQKIVIDGPNHEFIFCKKEGKWGVFSFEGLYVEKMYDNVYIVNYKSDKSFVVITNKNGEWEMYEQTDKEKLYYDVTAAEIKKLIKTSEPSGFLDVKF